MIAALEVPVEECRDLPFRDIEYLEAHPPFFSTA